jgi:hypothetical protein
MKSNEEQNPEQILRALRIDPVSESVREKARYRTLTAYRNHPTHEKKRSRLSWWICSFASAAALFVAALVMHPKSGSRTQNLHVFSEVESMFSGRLLAVIKDGERLDLKLSGSVESLPNDQRILITLRKNTRLIQVLTYSGHPVNLQLEGHTAALTPLLSSDGSVMIITDRRLLHGSKNSGFEGFSVIAKAVEGGRS